MINLVHEFVTRVLNLTLQGQIPRYVTCFDGKVNRLIVTPIRFPLYILCTRVASTGGSMLHSLCYQKKKDLAC